MESTHRVKMIDALIFSKNRPMQLHCLLSSIKEYSDLQEQNITVLYKYDEDFLEGLEKVKELHKNIKFKKEEDFEIQVKHYLKLGEKYCVFFVDDIIFKDTTSFSLCCNILEANQSILTFSLRLGTHLTECYPMSSRQTVPPGIKNSELFAWGWQGSDLDWGYPFSVDGHIFRRSELESWASHLKFKNPNQFESSLQEIPRIFALPPGAACYLDSRLFNNPANRVQEEFQNRAESQFSAKQFNELWMSGLEIDYNPYKSLKNNAAHTPVTFITRPRK